jgi:hypothetical protein
MRFGISYSMVASSAAAAVFRFLDATGFSFYVSHVPSYNRIPAFSGPS